MAIISGSGRELSMKKRVFTPVKINVAWKRFRTILSTRRKHVAHSGALEATGVVLGLKWYLRKKQHHATRLPMLVDAQAVLGALVKGRSSAPTLFREIRRAAALSIAGDLLVKYIYVPSEVNPADGPSRGVRRTVHERSSVHLLSCCPVHQHQKELTRRERFRTKKSKQIKKHKSEF